MPRRLEWLDLATPSFTNLDSESLVDIVGFLNSRPGGLFLLGDSSILYSLCGRCSPSPVLWFHPHLTVPWSGTQATLAFQEDLIQRLEASQVRFFVVENNGTQMGVNLQSLPAVSEWLARRVERRVPIGAFEVFELGPREPSLGALHMR